jgi:hypothetical protein
MNKALFFFTFSVLSAQVLAQRAKEIQVRAGYGLGVYKTQTELAYTFGNIKISDDTTDGAATAHIPVELRYEVSDRVNLGLDMKFGRYLYAPEDQMSGRHNRFTIIGLGAEVNLFSDDDARVYLNGGFNTGTLEMHDVIASGLINLSQKVVYKGNGLKFSLGTMFFIKNGPIGINLNLGYDRHNFILKSYEVEGTLQNITNFEGSLTAGGLEMNGGLVFRIMP